MKLRFEGGVEANVRLDRVVGRLCTTRRDMQNASFRAPAGARMRVDGAGHRGFVLELEHPCACCGLHGRISEVSWDAVVIDGKPPRPPGKRELDAARKLGGEEAAQALLDAWERGKSNE